MLWPTIAYLPFIDFQNKSACHADSKTYGDRVLGTFKHAFLCRA